MTAAVPLGAELWFVFDPLCGWCYAAHPGLKALQAERDIPLHFLPAGLFSGRPQTPAFRDYAWRADQRIAQLTGQPFTETYYRQVLSDFSKMIDSAVPTLAFHVLAQAAPERALEVLHRIQALRYVDGKDVTSPVVLSQLAPAVGLSVEDFLAAFAPGSVEQKQVQARVAVARSLMGRLQLQGVPDLILRQGGREWVAPAGLLYEQGPALKRWIDERVAQSA